MFKSWNSHAVWTWFLLEYPQDGPRFVCMMLSDKMSRPGMSILSMLQLSSTLLVELTSFTFDFTSRHYFAQPDSTYEILLFLWFSCVFGVILDWNQVKGKNNNHTYLFHCINICRVPRKTFEHSTLWPRGQTTSSGTRKTFEHSALWPRGQTTSSGTRKTFEHSALWPHGQTTSSGTRKTFEHSALWPRGQTTSSGTRKTSEHSALWPHGQTTSSGTRKTFEHSALWPHGQTTSSGPCKC